MQLEVQNGDLELVPAPGAVNVIASDSNTTVELRVTREEDLGRLSDGIRGGERADIELNDGVISWEPDRGLYVEALDGGDLYLICSPDEREQMAEGFANTRPGE